MEDYSPGLRAGTMARDLNERGTADHYIIRDVRIKKIGNNFMPSGLDLPSGKSISHFLKSEFRIQRCKLSALAELE